MPIALHALFAPAAAAQSPLSITIPTSLGPAQRVTARLHPDSVRLLAERNKYFPGFVLSAWIEVDGRVIDIAPVAADGQFEFVVPSSIAANGAATTRPTAKNAAGTVARGETVSVVGGESPTGARGESRKFVVTPSTIRTPKHEPLPWSCELVRTEPLDGDVTRFAIDVGHPNDAVWLERGFSYQEGATHRGDSWATDINFRWTDLGFRVRVPILPRNRHRFTFRGHVPVGFEVHADGRVLARFEQPIDAGVYAFHDFAPAPARLSSFADAGARSLAAEDVTSVTMRVESLSPFPVPNLDLRTLFWALDRIEVESIGGDDAAGMWIPTASLLETAFRSALHAGLGATRPVQIEIRADAETHDVFKSDVQLQQEALLVVSCGGAMDCGPPETGSSSAADLLKLCDETAARTGSAFGDTRIAADVAVYISRSQWEAYVARPSTSYGVLASAFGAFAMMHDARLPCVVISDERLLEMAGIGETASGAINTRDKGAAVAPSAGAGNNTESAIGGVRCIIVPNATGVPRAAWGNLRRFVETGGAVIALPSLSLPRAEENGDAAAMFGAAVREYHRSHFHFRLGDEWVKLHNADWQAMLTVSTAMPMLPLVTNPSRPAAGGESPAVTVNALGRGRAALVCFDLFDQYIRYGDPAYRRLIAHVIESISPGRIVEVEGTGLAMPSVREAEDHLVVSVLNVSRGHFDHGGLMNAARTAVFAEQIPELGAMTVRVRCPRRIVGVSELECGDERAAPREWKWEDGVMTISVSELGLFRAWRAEFEGG